MKHAGKRRATTTGVVALALVLIAPLYAGGGREPPRADQPGGSQPIQIAQPWVRAVTSAGGNTGAYMQIRNSAATPDRLLAARASGVRTVELHTHEMDGGMARMRQVPEIILPPGEIVELAPRGLHVMLMGVETTLLQGSTLEMTLIFEHAGEINLTVPVRSITGEPSAMEGEMPRRGASSH
jgi:periplasmic copper chaperone A